MNKIILNATQIFKHFGEGLERVNVLNGLTLEIREGESLAIVGSSGSGKSTLLHLLGGLDTPSSGEVTMLGRNWMKMNDAERSTTRNTHLGFVYQMNHLLSDFTALENVAMPLRIRGDEKSEALNKAKTELESVGLGHRLTHKPSALSGGERQRVAIARALVTNPSCILADEPTGNLDKKTAEQVFVMLLDRVSTKRLALVLITHDENLATRCQSVLPLEKVRV